MEQEQKGKEAVPAPQMTEGQKLGIYKYFVEMDFESHYIPEYRAHLWPGGAEAARAFNDSMSRMVEDFRGYSAKRLKEYEAEGYIEYCPSDGKLPFNIRLTGKGK